MTASPQDVLVIHPHAARRAALASALPASRVIAVDSKLEATRRMEDVIPSLIVSSPDDARRFMLQVERVAPGAARVFVCSQSDSAGLEELMRTAAEGHDFAVVDDSLTGPELGRTLSHLLHGYNSARLLLAEPLVAQLYLDELPLSARCLELGNFGATLQFAPPLGAAHFTPGRVLRNVLFEREGRMVMRLPSTYVQQARSLGPLGGVLVTVSWAASLQPLPQGPSFRIQGQEVRATLEQAIERRSSLWLSLVAEMPLQVCLEGPELVQELGMPVLVANPRVPLQGVLSQRLQLFFELGGQSYSGHCPLLRILPDSRIMLGLPSLLYMRNWRSLPRFKPPAQHPFLISFSTPGGQQRLTRSLLDLSCGGLAFPFDPQMEVLPAGSRVEASLLLPDGSQATCPLEVRSIQALPSYGQSDGGLRPFRAGASFLELPAPARDAILRAFMTSRCANAVDGGGIPFAGIWQLMQQARYNFHPDYPFGSAARVLEELADTHQRLYGALDLGCCVLYNDEQQGRGHVAGLRIHSRTWLVQHLAVDQSFTRQSSLSQTLTTLQVELGEAQPDIEFIRYSWRQDNRWPNRLASWVAEAMGNHELSLQRSFHYMRRPLPPGPLPSAPAGLPRVREATASDRQWLERHLRERGELVRLLSEDLVADSVELEELGRRFESRGLYRRRRLLVVDGEHQPLGLALVEEGSPGLNLIEKTNSFSLVLPEPLHHPDTRRAAHALIQRCLQLAQQRGRPAAVVLAPEEHVALLAEAGFSDMGRFSEWIFHRSLVRRWCELVSALFARLMRRAQHGGEPLDARGDGCT